MGWVHLTTGRPELEASAGRFNMGKEIRCRKRKSHAISMSRITSTQASFVLLGSCTISVFSLPAWQCRLYFIWLLSHSSPSPITQSSYCRDTGRCDPGDTLGNFWMLSPHVRL
ncbi:hypothetical protein SCLCIDRAFT_1212182 [Scleroderma citrinum Foug A]|uniref:Uncharacterized protein n=1 Tax=Scleroderma citrinum Foug A TaxID=1036808 RepID=A0A0C3DY17_9AGAM|nr:hypothetical protein SCLCIDRAFT_1212182 [Scleroderma citrinum Foug A]